MARLVAVPGVRAEVVAVSGSRRHVYWRGRSQQTGRVVVIGHGEDLGLDVVSEGPWYTVCDEHHQLCSHATLRLARWHAADPLGWCEVCQALASDG